MKKIVHIMMACFYYEGMGYQENILPKKHKELGLDVSIIASQYSLMKDGIPQKRESGVYVNKDGIEVTILPFSKWYNQKARVLMILSIFMRKYTGLSKLLEDKNPDIIFIHGLQKKDTLDVVKYKKKHPNIKIYVDQHGDYYNTPITGIFRFITQKFFFAMIAQRISKCSEVMWGVTPWRVQFLQEVYRISSDKTGFLPMGGDDTFIDIKNKVSIRKTIRDKYAIADTDFLVISGGKIDKTKNIHLIMETVAELKNTNIKLLIFGILDDEMRGLIEKITQNSKNILFIGWIPSTEAYNYFLASDLGIFPGTHSVLWEQALSTGLPCIFKHWEGMEHVDLGGNAILLDEPDKDSQMYKNMIANLILELSSMDEMYTTMKVISETQCVKAFSYREIAKRSIQMEEAV